MLHHQFDDLVAENWGQNTEGFANTVSSFTEVLKVWKNTTFSNVFREKRRVLARLEGTRPQLQSYSLSSQS